MHENGGKAIGHMYRSGEGLSSSEIDVEDRQEKNDYRFEKVKFTLNKMKTKIRWRWGFLAKWKSEVQKCVVGMGSDEENGVDPRVT